MILSFVSGKGGVGKTSLAANYAWVSAQSRKTVLIDLDLQNRGLSGLLERFTNEVSFGAFEMLTEQHRMEEHYSSVVKISESLFFLPATSSKLDPLPTRLAALVASPDVGNSIKSRVMEIKRHFGFETIVLDCHGGLDYLSLGAHRVSDVTIMVTEADTVTFNGTLELLDFYETVPTGVEGGLEMSGCKDALTTTQILVNRIPPKYVYSDLELVYKQLVDRIGTEYRLAPEILAFFPQEDFLVASFGEYPFCAQLAPNSVFSKKLWLIDFVLTGGCISKGPSKISKKIMSKRFREKIQSCIISNEALNTQRMLSAFSAQTVGFALYLIVLVPLIIMTKGFQTLQYNVDKYSAILLGGGIVAATVFTWVMLSLCRAMWGAARFYSDKYKFKLALWTSLGRRLKLGERIILGRLMILRFTFFLSFVFFGLFFAEILVIGAAELVPIALRKIHS